MENLEALKSEVSSQIESLSLLKERIEKELSRASEPAAFEKGRWYMSSWGNLVNYQGDGISFGFGFLEQRWHYGGLGIRNNDPVCTFRLATKEEIESALIAEAKRRLDIGLPIRGLRRIEATDKWNSNGGNGYGYDDNKSKLLSVSWYYNAETDTLYNWGHGLAVVYEKGKFAEILKDEPIKIAGFEVKYDGNRCYVSVPGETIYYGKDEIEMMRQVLNKPKIKSLNVGCTGQYKVSHDDIQKILAGFK